MRKNKLIEKKREILRVALIISLFIIFIIGFSIKYSNKNIIYGKVKINGIDVSGLEKNQAIQLLKDELRKETLNKEVELYYIEYKRIFTLSEVNGDYNYSEVVEKAFKEGKVQNGIITMFNHFEMRNDKYFYDMEIKYDEIKMKNITEHVSKDLKRPEQNAKLSLNNGKFNITEEVVGLDVSIDKLMDEIGQSLKKEEFKILIPVKEIQPKVTKEVLSKINGELSTYVTYFSSSNINRVENIRLATKSIDGTILYGGESFSFNEATGKRDKENGYRSADVIVKGKLVPGYGGGVCQVSTTLYNAALLSDLDIIERHNHSIPSSYVKKGQDATVSYDYLDLKIKNTYEDPIYIQGISYSNRVVFKLYGNINKFDKSIKIHSEITDVVNYEIETEVDDSLAPGEKKVVQEGRKGYKVKTYKIIYKNNKIVDKILLSNDYYKPSTKIIKVGPKKIDTEE